MLHENRVFFRDLHAGNILVKPTGSSSPDLYFIDLHRALVLPWLLTWMKVKDLAQLCNSLTASKTDKIRFLKEYCKEERLVNNSFRILQEKIYSKSLKLELRRIKSRSKRCFKNSSVFEKQITRTEAYYGRKDFGRQKADSLVLKSIEDSNSTIKRSSKSVITAHKTEDGSLVCVKRYKFRGTAYSLKNLFRKSRAMKSWIAANGLIVRGVNTPLPQAMVEKKRGLLCIESYYISQWLPEAAELNDCIKNMLKSPQEKEIFIRAFARVIRQFHLKKIFHADLKSNNILVTADGNNRWSFYFVDLDRVSFNKELTFYQRANNLAQINASISKLMTVKDRLKFFRLYAEGTYLFCERKKYYEKILEISRTKITEPYGISFS